MKNMYILSNSKESDRFEKEFLPLFMDEYECEKIIDTKTRNEFDYYRISESDCLRVKEYIIAKNSF